MKAGTLLPGLPALLPLLMALALPLPLRAEGDRAGLVMMGASVLKIEVKRPQGGYALGSGNSIPEYVPVDGYLAMLEAARRIRAAEVVAQPAA